MADDVVILDSNCFNYLEDSAVATRIDRSLRVARLSIWPSALNALELAKTRNSHVRRRSLEIARRYLDGRPPLPLPDDVLTRSAAATAKGEPFFRFGESG